MMLRTVLVAGLTGLLVLAAAAGSAGSKPLVAGVSSIPLSDTVVPNSTTDGTLVETSFMSSVLGIGPPLRVYLPPGYNTSTERYPVLYMLHGNAPDSDYAEWSTRMKIDFAAGSAISRHQIVPMIIVMPYGQHSYFMNINGGLPWADYVTQDLVRYIDSTYRTIADREHRAIGGNSMGGTGALHLAFNHPDLFSIVGGHSPALRVAADPVISDWSSYASYDPLRLAETAPNLQTLRIWLDIGSLDPWRGNAGGLHDRLTARGISHTWNMYPGPHDTIYWVTHLPEYLQFYSTGFQQASQQPATTAVVAPPAQTAQPGSVQPSTAQAEYQLGFKTLAGLMPDIAGTPLENEHWGANGDSLQQTSGGLMVWRKADNWTAFTNGSRTWVNGPYGLQERANNERFGWEAGGAGSQTQNR